MHPIYFEDDIFKQIIYRGEGNSSIVIALKNQGKVIRLLKKDGKIMKSSQDHHVTQHPMRSIKFMHFIMKPLTRPFLRGTIELIHLKSEFMNRLSRHVEANRPTHRLNKTLRLDDQYALVMDDLCALPQKLVDRLHPDDLCGSTLSVEIKPKQGFLPFYHLGPQSQIMDHQVDMKLRHCCFYGSTQYLKLARGRISRRSDYCPINLFSGCPVRMRIALEALTINPQNNLRIFKDLTFAYGEGSQTKLSSIIGGIFNPCQTLSENTSSSQDQPKPSDDVSRLIDLLILCLLSEQSDSEDISKSQMDENSFHNMGTCLQHPTDIECKRCDMYPSVKKQKSNFNMNLTHELPGACVLSSVLRAQKLDTIGPYEAHYMLDWLLKRSEENGNVDVLEELSKPQMPSGFGSPHQLAHETRQQFYFRKVWEFLVSLTAKDCSIIITLRRVTSGHHRSVLNKLKNFKGHLIKEQKSGDYYLFNVDVADLDQKMPLKIPRICENLNTILTAQRERASS